MYPYLSHVYLNGENCFFVVLASMRKARCINENLAYHSLSGYVQIEPTNDGNREGYMKSMVDVEGQTWYEIDRSMVAT